MTMARVVVFLALGAHGLVAPPQASKATKLYSTEYAKSLYGVGPETGFWDPLGLADLGSDATVDFFRASEVKHGRIAMMATLGYMHHLAGIQFPGLLSSSEGLTFKALGAMSPVEAWAAVPSAGVAQIFGAISIVEAYEMTHRGGKYVGPDAWFKGFSSDLSFDPLKFGDNEDKALVEKMKLRELKNGRLAMIGIMGYVAANVVPGSVPLLA